MSQTLTYIIDADDRALVDDVQSFRIDWSRQRNDNWITARQWESGLRQVFVNVKHQDGTPFDLTGCNVWFEGYLPDSSLGNFRILDDEGYVPLDPSNGEFRFDMPKQAFPLAGSYRQAFFRILKNGNSVTTLEFDLKVLADKVITDLVPRDWISPFERIANELLEQFKNHTAQADKSLNEVETKIAALEERMKKLKEPHWSKWYAMNHTVSVNGPQGTGEVSDLIVHRYGNYIEVSCKINTNSNAWKSYVTGLPLPPNDGPSVAVISGNQGHVGYFNLDKGGKLNVRADNNDAYDIHYTYLASGPDYDIQY